MRNSLFILVAVFSFHAARAQSDLGGQGYRRDYRFLESFSRVQDRNFYLLTLFQEVAPVNALLTGDAVLAAVRERVLQRLEQSARVCDKDRACLVDAFIWPAKDALDVRERLVALAKSEKALKALVRDHMRPSGYFQHLASLDDAEMIGVAWDEGVKGMNRIMDVYGNGKAPMYPRIDSVTYDVRSKNYRDAICLWASETRSGAARSKQFFFPSLQFALVLLDINSRDEAARYEPMERLENREACAAIPNLKWEKYPYTAIVILGAVSPIYNSKLPPLGKLNVKLGAENFTQGLAPLIIVSGGHVHPFRTANCEAIEMKRELMEKYRIPEACIMIEPHARHTTTNLRNASRLIYRYGIPAERKFLITTNSDHSTYIETEEFTKRCQNELGFQPGQILKRISPSTLEFLPDISSLTRSSIDPLDP